MLEYYGGNDSKMRTNEDCKRSHEDQQYPLNFKQELTKLNKHFDGNFVVVNAAKSGNIDSDFD